MYFLSLGVTGLIWGACIRQMNCDTREQGMNQSIHSMNSSGFHSTKPFPGANYSTTNSHNSICCESGGNNKIWTIGNVINKNRTILYLIRPAEAAMEREQLRSRWNVDKIGGGATLLTKAHFQTCAAELFYHQFSQLYMLWIRGE